MAIPTIYLCFFRNKNALPLYEAFFAVYLGRVEKYTRSGQRNELFKERKIPTQASLLPNAIYCFLLKASAMFYIESYFIFFRGSLGFKTSMGAKHEGRILNFEISTKCGVKGEAMTVAR